MKRIVSLILVIFLLLSLAACQTKPEDAASSSAPTEVPTLRMTDPAPSEATPAEDTQSENDFPADFNVWRSLDEIEVYPFTEQELADAAAEAERTILGFFSGEEVLEYELKNIAFDPELTDAYIRQRLSAEKSMAAEADYYATTIVYAGRYSASYDHTKSPMQDTTDNTVLIELSRDSVGGSWYYLEGHSMWASPTPEDYAAVAMSAEALKNYKAGDISGRLIAGYAHRDGSYDLYAVEEDGTVHHHLIR